MNLVLVLQPNLHLDCKSRIPEQVCWIAHAVLEQLLSLCQLFYFDVNALSTTIHLYSLY